MAFVVAHHVSIPDPKSHLCQVQTTISSPGPLPESLVLFMPAWTPGSYLLREYARHVERFETEAPARALKLRKNAWAVETGGASRVVVRYWVYANELTVRTSHVDETHAFLVGAALFMAIEGAVQTGATVELEAPREWKVATALTAAASPAGVVRFDAPDFDTLIDSPIAAGAHREERFDVLGVPHAYAIWPATAVGDTDVRRLVADTRSLLEQEARLFGGRLPYRAYALLLHLSTRGRGGLEHRDSSALIAHPSSFASREGYLDLLSLVAHECFHAWNIKRIRPAGLVPYDYQSECYTRTLWWFEGGTSYYDWRVLALAKLCSVEEYLDHLATEIAYLDQTPGRLVQPLEEASFDAWIKLYRPDENTANSNVSYYRKGELVCALLDLEIRARTAGRVALDAVLARLWTEHGAPEVPVPEDGLQAFFERVAQVPLDDLFAAWIRSSKEIDPGPTLAHVGLAVERPLRADGPPCSIGARLRADGARLFVATVMRDAAAWRAGIDPGDELLALKGARVEGPSLDAALRGLAPGETVDVVLARDGRLVTRRITLDPPRPERVKLVAQRDAPPSARAAFTAWLGSPHPAWGSEVVTAKRAAVGGGALP